MHKNAAAPLNQLTGFTEASETDTVNDNKNTAEGRYKTIITVFHKL